MLSVNDLEKNLDRVHEWIRSADQKISIFFAFQGAVLLLLGPKLLVWLRISQYQSAVYALPCLLGGGIMLLISSVVMCKALIPNLTNLSIFKSLSFFGDIASMNEVDYKAIVDNAGEDAVRADLIHQIYASSVIAKFKHVNFTKSVNWFGLGIVLVAVGRVLLELDI